MPTRSTISNSINLALAACIIHTENFVAWCTPEKVAPKLEFIFGTLDAGCLFAFFPVAPHINEIMAHSLKCHHSATTKKTTINDVH